MSNHSARYEDQLPKHKWSLDKIFNYTTGTVGLFGIIFGILTYFKVLKEEHATLFLIVLLFVFLVFLCVYTYLRERRKLHRYSQAVLYLHYVNHLVRDHLSMAKNGNLSYTEEILQDIVDAVANCFSLLVGKKCRCSFKELSDEKFIKTVFRDRVTRTKLSFPETNQSLQPTLEANTDFSNLWFAENGCSRFYLCNNLLKAWKDGYYENSSFNFYGEPQKIGFGKCSMVTNWKLPYRSTLVLPIRYVKAFSPPKKTVDVVLNNENENWVYWGFLCIDSGSRNVFDQEFAPEVGAAFADVLYIFNDLTSHLMSQAE